MTLDLTSRRWMRRSAVALALALLAAFLYAGPAAAVHDEDMQLDGDTAVDAGDPPLDWESFFDANGAEITPLPSGFVDVGFRADFALPDPSAFHGNSKDTLPISSWQCKSANSLGMGGKFDLQNTYAAAQIVDGETIVYVAGERGSDNGNTNIGVWFTQDETVDCQSAGGITDFTGDHVDGDIFVVAELTAGGSVAGLKAYKWEGGANGTLNPTPFADGITCSNAAAGDDLCAIANDTTINPPWAPDADLLSPQFFELGINLSALGITECFNRALTNTRSSQSLTATLHDYNVFTLETCADVNVRKYIDVDMSGSLTDGDITSGTDVAGWTFDFYEDVNNTPDDPTDDTPVTGCTGLTTGTDGTVECADQQLGAEFRVEETQQTGFHNTQPGPIVNRDSAISRFVTNDGTEWLFGNTCFVDLTFEVTGVPDTVSSVTVDYEVVSGPDTGESAPIGSGSVSLDEQGDGTTWQGSQDDTFVQTDVVAWEWYINGDSANAVQGSAGVDLSDDAYPDCADTNSNEFPLTDVTGTKVKDGNGDGALDDPDVDGAPLADFEFELIDSNDQVVDTATSDAQGEYTFEDVAPGTYTVNEKDKTNWLQTVPANGGDRTVVITLGDTTATIDPFGNTPLSRVKVEFEDLTGFTDVTIDCPDAIGDASSEDGAQNETVSTESSTLPPGEYTCTVTIVDP